MQRLSDRSRTILVIAGLIAACGLLFSGRFRDCYDGRLVGTAAHHMTVADVRAGKTRSPHTYSSSDIVMSISQWKAGDDLHVCNNMVTNRTKGESVPCGDFGCLAIWP